MFTFLSENKLNIFYYRQAEDAKRDEMDAQNQLALTQSSSHVFDEGYNTSSNGRLITISNYKTDEYDDPISVCSCTCAGQTGCINHLHFTDDNPNPTDIITLNASHLKRASI